MEGTKAMTTSFLAIDFETTGIPGDGQDSPEYGAHEVIEVGCCAVTTSATGQLQIHPPASIFCRPDRSIPPGASAVHHILDHHVANAPAAEDVLADIAASGEPLVAHNDRFERRFFNPSGALWIDTYRCALRVWPEAPGHGNQTLRYWLGLDRLEGFDPQHAMPAHRAGPDAYVTAHILAQLIAATGDAGQLFEWSSQPALLRRVRFGKHRGTPWSEVPQDYLEWVVRQHDMDEDVRHTAAYWLGSVVAN